MKIHKFITLIANTAYTGSYRFVINGQTIAMDFEDGEDCHVFLIDEHGIGHEIQIVPSQLTGTKPWHNKWCGHHISAKYLEYPIKTYKERWVDAHLCDFNGQGRDKYGR